MRTKRQLGGRQRNKKKHDVLSQSVCKEGGGRVEAGKRQRPKNFFLGGGAGARFFMCGERGKRGKGKPSVQASFRAGLCVVGVVSRQKPRARHHHQRGSWVVWEWGLWGWVGTGAFFAPTPQRRSRATAFFPCLNHQRGRKGREGGTINVVWGTSWKRDKGRRGSTQNKKKQKQSC